jgi:hypothetical protein
MHGLMEESIYTKAVTTLVKYIQSQTPIKDSLFEQAEVYFESSAKDKETRIALQEDIANIKAALLASNRKRNTRLQKSSMMHSEPTKMNGLVNKNYARSVTRKRQKLVANC